MGAYTSDHKAFQSIQTSYKITSKQTSYHITIYYSLFLSTINSSSIQTQKVIITMYFSDINTSNRFCLLNTESGLVLNSYIQFVTVPSHSSEVGVAQFNDGETNHAMQFQVNSETNS